MSKYLITYQLHNENDYSGIHNAIKKIGGKKVIKSVYNLTLKNSNCIEIYNNLKDFIDESSGDEIIIVEYINFKQSKKNK